MYEINSLIKKNDLKPRSYKKIGKTMIVDSDKGKFVIKEKGEDHHQIFNYLKSRNFDYYPKILDEDDKYELIPFIEEIDIPKEQKILDMIDLIALLHSKTTYYKEIDKEDYKKIYEDIQNNIEYLFSYYNDIITIIESKIYMSPSEYLLARNISIIFYSLNDCKEKIEKWYELVKDIKKQRNVVLHNNLEIDHFLEDENNYLISWNKTKIDLPIFDLYKLYKKHNLDFDFESILKRYETTYPLLEEEKGLLFILIALPDKIEFDSTEYENCKKISKIIDQIYKTRDLISPYDAKNTKNKP